MYTMEYYSAIKKNEIAAFAAVWMGLGIATLGKVSQMEKEPKINARKKPYCNRNEECL